MSADEIWAVNQRKQVPFAAGVSVVQRRRFWSGWLWRPSSVGMRAHVSDSQGPGRSLCRCRCHDRQELWGKLLRERLKTVRRGGLVEQAGAPGV
jgi:hypothetical protein